MRLEIISEKNYKEVINLTTAENQGEFVSSNALSLAHAWVFYDRAKPYAIYIDEKLVGFIMFDYKPQEKKVEVWRFMIGKEFQGKGYGKKALQIAIEHLKKEKLFNFIQINYVENNDAAKHLYRKLGFVETGDIEGKEIVMKLDI